MSDRNDYDYYKFDNYDESIDSREYRRRQPDRRNNRNTTMNGRPPYNKRRPSKRRMRARTLNRIIMVATCVLAITLVIVLLVLMIRSCNPGGSSTNASTETKPAETTTVAATEANRTTATVNTDKLAIDNFIPANPTNNNASGYVANAIYVWNNQAFELFGGSDDTVEGYVDMVNDLSGKLTGMNVYSMIIPNHTEMGLPARLKDSGDAPTTSQADNIKTAYAAMDKSKVTPINAYNYLSEHCNDYIYFKSDHHWTGLGSYYAYTAFADTLGMPKLALEDCTEGTIDGFTGSLYNYAEGIDTDTVHYWQFPYSVTMDITDDYGNTQTYDSPYFEGEEGGSLAYGVFIFGDNPLTVMKSSSDKATAGRKIAVIKESYGNAFVPYLTCNYEEVHVCDLRSFRDASSVDFPTYCRNNGITDVLFLNGVMSANNADHFDSIEAMFN